MALRVVTVKSSGGDYSSLNAAAAGEATDLVAADRQLEIDCYNFVDTTAVNFGGGGAWTTDATHGCLVKAVDNHGGLFGGAGGTSAYSLQVSGTWAITQASTITWISYTGLSVSSDANGCWLGGQNAIVYDRCHSRTSANGAIGFYIDQTAGFGLTAVCKSCVAVSLAGAGSAGFYLADVVSCLDCNAIAGTNGFLAPSATSILKNCLTAFCSAGYATTGSGAFTMTTCASDDATASGTGARINQTFTFVNAPAQDYHLAAGDAGAKGFGTDLSADGVTVDIDSQSIASPWNIGADQFPPASAGAPVTIREVYDSTNTLKGWFDPTLWQSGWIDDELADSVTGAPRSTIRGGLPPVRRWVGYAALLVPAIQGPLVTGAPRKVISAAVPITRPWVGYARNLKPAIRGPLVPGAPRDTIKAGLGNGLAIVRWSPYGAKLLQPAIRGPLVAGSPRDTIRGGLPIVRPWIGYAKDLRPAIRGPLVTGQPRAVIRAGVPIALSRIAFVQVARIFEAKPGVVASTSGSPHLSIRGGLPPANRWVGFPQLLRPAIRGPLVTGLPRETIRAGLGNGLAIIRWAPYGAHVIEPAIRGPLVTGARRSTIVGAVPIVRARIPFARIFTHALGGKVIAGQVTTARGTPITRRWTGFALVARPAIRGALVSGSPRATVRAGVPITASRVAFSPVARVFEAKTGVVAGTTGAPRTTTRAGLPITRRWTGFALVLRPAIRGSLVTGSPRDTIRGAAPISRPWIGYARILRPAIRGPLVVGAPRDTIVGGLRITRPWVGTTSVTRPAIRGALVTGSPRHTISGGLPPARRWVGFAILTRPAIRGPLVQGSPRDTIRAGVLPVRGTGRVVQTGPQIGVPSAAFSFHRTIAAGLPISSIVSARRVGTGGRVVVFRPAVRGPLVTGARRLTTRGAVPILRAWPGIAHAFSRTRVHLLPNDQATQIVHLADVEPIDTTPRVSLSKTTPTASLATAAPSVALANSAAVVSAAKLDPVLDRADTTVHVSEILP